MGAKARSSMSSLEDKANALQPTCEEYYSDDSLKQRRREIIERDFKPEAPLPPTSYPLSSTLPPSHPLLHVSSNASDSGYSSRTAATLNSADSAKAFLAKVGTSQNSTFKPPQESSSTPVDVPQKSKESPPTSYKEVPVARSKSTSKVKKEGSMRGHYRPGPPPVAYRTPRPGITPLQTTAVPTYPYPSVQQPLYSPACVPAAVVEANPIPVSWSADPAIVPFRRRSQAQRPANVSLVAGVDGQLVAISSAPVPQQQSYMLVDLNALSPATRAESKVSSSGSRHKHSSRDTSRRRLADEPSSSRSRKSSVYGGALVSYGSNPIQNSTSSGHRSRSKDHRRKGKTREREEDQADVFSDDEFDEAPPSPKRDALVRTTPHRESTSSSRPTYQRSKSSYYEDSYRSSREPKRVTTDRPPKRRDSSTAPAVTTQTTVQRTTSRQESSSHRRTRSNDPVIEETEDKMREAEKHMQKSSASRRASDIRKQVIATSAQPVVSVSHQAVQRTGSVRRPSEAGSHRNAVPSVAESSRTAASQPRTDAGGSVRFAHDPTKALYFTGDVDFSLREGMAELTIGGSRGREQQYPGSSKSGGSFAERASRR